MSTLSEKGQFMSSTYYLRVKLLASIHVCTCLTNESVLQEGLLLSSLPLSGAQEYYVTPTQPPNPACPSGKPCHTLNDYAKNSSDLFSGKDDVSLLFLDGLHNLSDYSLEITNKMCLTIAGVNVSTIKIDQRARSRITILSVYISLEGFYDYANDLPIISVKGAQRFTQNQLVATHLYFDICGTAEVYMINSRYDQSMICVLRCPVQLGTFFNISDLVKSTITIKGSRINNLK